MAPTTFLRTLTTISLACIAGCSLSAPYPDRALYTITVPPPAQRDATPPEGPALRVRRIVPVAPYGGTPFLYRTGPQSLKTDYYSAFAAAPAELITGNLVQWLRATRHFTSVADSNAGLSTPLALEGRLQELVVDTTATPTAVVTLEFVLLDEHDTNPRVLLEHTYTEHAPLTAATPQAAAAAWSTACRQAFTHLTEDLQKIDAPHSEK